jgi:glycosyltransferase involved in cell wall biosynthesis
MIRVMHVITTLGPAGAETMLCRIAAGMDTVRFENEVVSLTGILDLAGKMERIGVPVRTLGMTKGIPNPWLVLRLAKWIRESKPDVIHTWMYHANLVGALAARIAGNVPVVWGVHHNSFDPRVNKRRTLLVNRACALLSRRLPARVVFCSEASLDLHRKLGYAPQKLEVIPNGFDLGQLRPNSSARRSLHAELGIPADAGLIGMAARFHPHKDHRNFIRAAGRIHKRIPTIHFILCGLNVTRSNSQLTRWIADEGLSDCCHLLGVREDMPRIFAAIDIATTSSLSEAFPVVIGEAMACGTPCVVTDVGDSARIVDRAGIVVPPGDPVKLADALITLMEAGPEVRRRLGVNARARIEQNFALPDVVARYQAVYEQLARRRRHPADPWPVSQWA